jgi:hypothetical protein
MGISGTSPDLPALETVHAHSMSRLEGSREPRPIFFCTGITTLCDAHISWVPLLIANYTYSHFLNQYLYNGEVEKSSFITLFLLLVT